MHDGVKTYETSFPNYWCYVQYSADIYFFLQYSNYVIFPMSTGTFFDCSVEKAITSGELSEISKEKLILDF